MNNKKKELFESTPLNKAILILSVPTVISSLVMVLYSLADTYFVGMINIKEETAAVTIASVLLLAFNAVNNLFGVGGASLISRSLGKKDYETAHKASAFCFYLAIFSGILFSIFVSVFKGPLLNILGADASTIESTSRYVFYTVSLGAVPAILSVVMANLVRSEGCSLQSSIGSMTGCLLNIVLDPIFILIFDMKAAGAGLATLISNCVACIYFFIYIIRQRKNTVLSFHIKDLRFEKDVTKEVFGVGLPASVQNLLNVTSQGILNNKAAVYGAAAVAAIGIDHRVCLIPLMIIMGIGQGIMPLISYNYASGNYERMKKAIYKTLFVSIFGALLLTAFYFFGSDFIISLFIKDLETINHGSKLLKLHCLNLIFICIDFVSVGVFQATGKGKMSLFLAILRKIILEIPLLIVLDYIYPLYGMSLAQTLAEVGVAMVAIYFLSHLIKNCRYSI
ncbi:MAG: MATE family efflux transporter [Erysipelotrichaceae bacterium]|nr:MATE family efflux transporter [Erysipelotrichaceae bacterium]